MVKAVKLKKHKKKLDCLNYILMLLTVTDLHVHIYFKSYF